MLAKITSGAVVGVDGILVTVEVDLARGLPAFATVGLAEGAVREAKDRVKAAIKNAGYPFPDQRITVNLAPADLKKAGTMYDLPMALGILAASGLFPVERGAGWLIVGELSLDGSLRPTAGVLPLALAAREAGLRGVMVPAANGDEAAVVDDLQVVAVTSLGQAVDILAGAVEPPLHRRQAPPAPTVAADVDLAEVRGQEHAKRALEISAAGGHNLLMQGPPGSGKTMLARRLPTILPDLSFAEALETSKIYSTSGLLEPGAGLVRQRPFRAPHHTISDAGLVGGGQIPRPGEVSLAHNGVLFLDELPEFRRHVLEVLRQPLEDGHVTIARATTTVRFPARFMLIAAMNPCPCGLAGDGRDRCTCTPVQLQRYRRRLSAPLLDRIDLHLEVAPVPFTDLTGTGRPESSATVRQRVVAARQRQAHRFRHAPIFANAQMGPKELERHCPLDDNGRRLLAMAVRRLGLSARAYHRVVKIARTIADLADREQITEQDLAEAVQYRRLGLDNAIPS